MNRIEIRKPQLANRTTSKLAYVKLSEIFVNNEFYTAIIGTNFDPKTKRFTKYRFIHDSLNAIIEPSNSPDSLYIPLKQKLLELDNYELYNLLYKTEESKNEQK